MYHEKIDHLLDTYARKLAENMNQGFAIDARVPSVMIAGPANFPVGKKEKQNRARDSNMEEWRYIHIFKQKVIEYKWLHHLSLNQTAAKFSIPNTGTISTWEKLYHSYGFSGLLAKKRGRPSMKKSKYKVNKPKKELSYVEKLEQEVYLLRMENDLLKSGMP